MKAFLKLCNVLCTIFLGVLAAEYSNMQDFYCPITKVSFLNYTITSPNYPAPYMNQCQVWYIFVKSGYSLTISFDDIDMPSSTLVGCSENFVSIGPKPTISYCGNLNERRPRPYYTHLDKIWIKFLASGSQTGRGFSLSYVMSPPVSSGHKCSKNDFRCKNGQCIFKKWRCNGLNECFDKSDELDCEGPSKAKVLPPKIDCPVGQFSCRSMLSKNWTCLPDSKKCNKMPDCVGNEDESDCDHVTCGGHYEGPSGKFSSPDSKASKLNLRDGFCYWTIHVDYSATIQLRFGHFSLAGNAFIEIYDGGEQFHDLIGLYKEGKPPPKLIETQKNRMFFKFRPDPTEGVAFQRFNATFQKKGFCLKNQEKCQHENDCFMRSERCDGVWNCKKRGDDERGCGACDMNKYPCGKGSNRCYTEADHCNGMGLCYDNNDERNCTSDVCGPHNGTFLCENKRCIYESWLCDGTDDCEDNSDETNCPAIPSNRIILAAVVGSLICGLVLIIALGCTLKLFTLRLQEQQGYSDTPMSRMQAEFNRRPAPPSYAEAMRTSWSWQEFMDYMRSSGRRGRSSSGNNNNLIQIHGGENEGRTEINSLTPQQGESDTGANSNTSNPLVVPVDIEDDVNDESPLVQEMSLSINVDNISESSGSVCILADDANGNGDNVSESSGSVCILAEETVDCVVHANPCDNSQQEDQHEEGTDTQVAMVTETNNTSVGTANDDDENLSGAIIDNQIETDGFENQAFEEESDLTEA